MPVSASTVMEMQFSGSAGAWSDISSDVRLGPGIRGRYGIFGAGPLDRVAETGTLSFSLDNSARNSGGKLGYYAPGSASARSGFEVGIGTRIKFTYSGSTFYKWVGNLDQLAPSSGAYGRRLTECTAVDWMNETYMRSIQRVALQTNQRGDQLVATVVGAMTKKPSASSLNTGQDTFPYALDNAESERYTPAAVFQQIAQSELGYINLEGDTSTGGVLRFIDRHARPKSSVSASIVGVQVSMDTNRPRSLVMDRVRVEVFPRRVDTASQVLYRMQSVPLISPSTLLTIEAPYSDPNQRAVRVGGASMITPASSTDFTLNSASDGSGSSLLADFSVSASFGANSATVTGSYGGSITSYWTKQELRGFGLYDYETVVISASNGTTTGCYGENTLEVRMPLQSSVLVGQDAARAILAQNDDPATRPQRVTFVANESNANMLAFLQAEPSDLILVTDPTSGIDGNFFVNGIEFEVRGPNTIWCTWLLAPSDSSVYWVLGNAGFSELGETTTLGY